ncbi:hypothetical protein ACHAWF_013425 [Thalassiosira exigua]
MASFRPNWRSPKRVGPGRSGRGRTPSYAVLWALVASVGVFSFVVSHNCATTAPASPSGPDRVPPPPSSGRASSAGRPPINSFWWPSPESSGGFLSAIHAVQHPRNCTANTTKFFVMRSHRENSRDNRGLSAWSTVTMQHMQHAFSDGDNFELGRRLLINDEKLWPMAKGCKHRRETRECYFLPLTNCKLSDVDPISAGNGSVAVLKEAKDEYDRSARTLYSSTKSKYPRLVMDKTSWSGLPGLSLDHSLTSLMAAFLAYNLQPRPWLRAEIDARLRRSIPPDLDPDRTVGVPIRRSDKCLGHNITGSAGGELDCPPMEDYLDALKKFIMFDPLIRNVIVTSEEAAASAEFVALLKKELPRIRVVTNVGDVQQGTGSASQLEVHTEGAKNEDVIASALTSFHMQLRARYFVLTTKSGWTCSISIFARVYGYSSSDVYAIDIGRNKNMYGEHARKGG